MLFTQPVPYEEAVASLKRRGLYPTAANSYELAGLPADLREQAFFSAKVSDARLLQTAYDAIAAIVQPEGRSPGQHVNEAVARQQIRATLARIGYAPEPGKEGTIEDLASEQRIHLIVQTQTDMARGRGSWLSMQDPDQLDMFPCQELFRLEEREVPRNWELRWRSNGGTFFDGRMIARKDDRIWYDISRFGTPYPPFDYNSGMWTEDVSRDEAEALGVIDADEAVEPQSAPKLSITAAVNDLAPFLIREVISHFGHRATVSDGILSLVP